MTKCQQLIEFTEYKLRTKEILSQQNRFLYSKKPMSLNKIKGYLIVYQMFKSNKLNLRHINSYSLAKMIFAFFNTFTMYQH